MMLLTSMLPWPQMCIKMEPNINPLVTLGKESQVSADIGKTICQVLVILRVRSSSDVLEQEVIKAWFQGSLGFAFPIAWTRRTST